MGSPPYRQVPISNLNFTKQCPCENNGQRCRRLRLCDRVTAAEGHADEVDSLIEQLSSSSVGCDTPEEVTEKARRIAELSMCLQCLQAGRAVEVQGKIVAQLPNQAQRRTLMNSTAAIYSTPSPTPSPQNGTITLLPERQTGTGGRIVIEKPAQQEAKRTEPTTLLTQSNPGPSCDIDRSKGKTAIRDMDNDVFQPLHPSNPDQNPLPTAQITVNLRSQTKPSHGKSISPAPLAAATTSTYQHFNLLKDYQRSNTAIAKLEDKIKALEMENKLLVVQNLTLNTAKKSLEAEHSALEAKSQNSRSLDEISSAEHNSLREKLLCSKRRESRAVEAEASALKEASLAKSEAHEGWNLYEQAKKLNWDLQNGLKALEGRERNAKDVKMLYVKLKELCEIASHGMSKLEKREKSAGEDESDHEDGDDEDDDDVFEPEYDDENADGADDDEGWFSVRKPVE